MKNYGQLGTTQVLDCSTIYLRYVGPDLWAKSPSHTLTHIQWISLQAGDLYKQALNQKQDSIRYRISQIYGVTSAWIKGGGEQKLLFNCTLLEMEDLVTFGPFETYPF